jgi:hypothetical protein
MILHWRAEQRKLPGKAPATAADTRQLTLLGSPGIFSRKSSRLILVTFWDDSFPREFGS